MRPRHLRLIAVAAVAATPALGACSTPERAPASSPDAEAVTSPDEQSASPQETTTNRPRLVATYDGGVLVLDGLDLEVVADIEMAGFNRLAGAGDGRHVLVSHTASEPGWHVLDAGAWTAAHGDHAHHFVGEPRLTGEVIPADVPAHVVPHDRLTTLFDDGTGDITVIDPAVLADDHRGNHTDEELTDEEHTDDGDAALVVARATSEAPHHGVAIRLSDGSMVATLGTAESRPGIRVVDATGAEVARNEDCPGVHGEGIAADETVVIGCENGVLLVRDGVITKIPSPTEFGRIGNVYVGEDDPIAAGDYKPDPDQGLVLNQVALVDTVTATIRVVDVPGGAGFTWRGVGRSDGEVVVLGTDGALHVVDPVTGAPRATWPVIEPWSAPEEWQTAHPALVVLEGTAYVTDPATQSVHAVDVLTGEVWASAVLPHATNELVVVTG